MGNAEGKRRIRILLTHAAYCVPGSVPGTG